MAGSIERCARGWLGAVAVFVIAGSGCGAMVAKTRFIGADIAIRAAERAGAERKATYDYTAAQVYFEKAREEEGKARFGFAIDYYGLAETHAEQAKVKALAADADVPPAGPPPTPNR